MARYRYLPMYVVIINTKLIIPISLNNSFKMYCCSELWFSFYSLIHKKIENKDNLIF